MSRFSLGVRLGVDAFGSFGSSVSGNGTSDAFYDPIGIEAEAGTVYESFIAFRADGDETRRSLTDIGSSPAIVNQDVSSINGFFSIGNLCFLFEQSVEDFSSNGSRSGSILTQQYFIINRGTERAEFELVRYLDGDLDFDGSSAATGGRRIQGEEILFETDNGEDASVATTFVGITARGGDETSPGRFEIDSFSGLRSRILEGVELDEEITGDGLNNDGFVNEPYDITLALRNSFSLEPGESEVYTTETIFGTVSPAELEISTSDLNLKELDTPLYRFHNTDVPGTYLYVDAEERSNILENFPNFREEGYAFKVADEPGFGVIPMHRFQSIENPGTYNFVGDEERDMIFSYYNESFTYEGVAFYVRHPSFCIGTEISRFQNSQNPGTYLFAGGAERDHIRAAYPGFIEEGNAFGVEL